MIDVCMKHASLNSGAPKGRITMRMLWEHMQHNFVLVRKEMKDGFDAVDRRFEQVDRRFDDVEKRLVRVERSTRNIEAQLDNVEIEKMPDRFKRIEEKVGIC
jgi:hypothetical protein